MLKPYIEKLINRQDLSRPETYEAILEICSSENIPQMSAFLTLLHAKRVSIDELVGTIQFLQENMQSIPTFYPTLDIVGTGGDLANTVNISTAAGLLAASCGIKVAKHGNRAATSKCGSADLLEALDCNIQLNAQQTAYCLEQTNFGFCFAPIFHPILKKLRLLRAQLDLSTIFNLVPPFLNPAQTQHMMIGVNHPDLLPLYAQTLKKLGKSHSMVFHSEGLDELTSIHTAQIIEIKNNQLISYELNPQQFNFKVGTLIDLQGKDAQDNSQKIMLAFSGQPSILADTLILNAAVALYLYGSTNSIAEGIPLAQQHLNSGAPMQLLNSYRAHTHQFLHPTSQ